MHSGGAINAVDTFATAFPHRSIGYMYEVKAIYIDDRDTAANMAWAQKLGDELAPYLQGACMHPAPWVASSRLT